MPDDPQRFHNEHRLWIWGQNLNKSLDAQIDLLHSLGRNFYDIALLQEPHIDFRGVSRAGCAWVLVYPPTHSKNQRATRSAILMNAHIPSSTWKPVSISSPDVTAVELTGDFGTIRIINIYNDCNHNEALDALRTYLRSPVAAEARCTTLPLRYIWAGNFNRHHPLWDELRNHHLFTLRNLNLTQPLLDMLARYTMKMALPAGIPTLRSFSTGNLMRVDNIFCSASLLGAYISCETAPEHRPSKTDHMPVIQILDIATPVVPHEPRPMFRKTVWGDFRKDLVRRLEAIDRPSSYTTTEDTEHAIDQLEAAIQATIKETVKMSKPSPYMKRWFSDDLRALKKEWVKLERDAYAQRFAPDHPAHAEARMVEAAYVKAVTAAKSSHWVEWLSRITDLDVWDAHKFLSAEPSDGGTTRIPTLELRHPTTKKVIETAVTNEVKSQWLKKEFFPPAMEVSSVPAIPLYPPPAWEWKPVSDALIGCAIDCMKPYKATFPGTTPNCVFKECTNLLVPYLGPIYRSLDDLNHYPDGWAELRVLVLRKPGKSNYAEPGAHRPIALTKGLPRLWYACKTLQCVAEAELAGILPKNQYGARPGRSTTDALHKVVKVVKDAWRKGKVATVLCMDVKGAFPSVDLDHLFHDMRMRGIPVQYTDWLRWRYANCTGCLTFGDFTSEPFRIKTGLDQGDPFSGFGYGIYNGDLADIPQPANNEDGVVFVDDNTLITVANTFRQTHRMVCSIMVRPEGVDEWGNKHNAKFSLPKYQLVDLSRR
jgi:exonuclease III